MPGKRHTVLVVDDSKTVQKLVEIALRDECRVLCASDGNEGLQIARSEHPDLILVDYQMPGMYGNVFCKKLREIPDLADTRLVLISAKSDAVAYYFEQVVGIVHRLQKPFDTKELVRITRELLTPDDGGTAEAAAERHCAEAPLVEPPTTDLQTGAMPRAADPAPAGPLGQPDGDLQEFARAILPRLVREAVGEALHQAGVGEHDDDLVLRAPLRRMSLADALSFANHHQVTGRVRILGKLVLGEVFVAAGRFVYARATRRGDGDPLVEVLLDKNRQGNDGQHILRALANADPGQLQIGRDLVAAGVVTAAAWNQALELHSRRALAALLEVGEGSLCLEACQLPDELVATTLRLPTMQVLMDGLRLVDERERARRALDDDEVVLHQLVEDGVAALLTEAEQEVLAQIDGQRTLREILAIGELDRDQVLCTCFRLLQVGVVRRRDGTLAGARS